MQGTTGDFGGDKKTMQNQINDAENEIKRLKNLLQQYEV